MLNRLQSSHFGIEKTKKRGREAMYWPGMTSDIENMISQCNKCLKIRKSMQKEPMTLRDPPTLPWQYIASDLFDYEGKAYLVVIDYYSKYIESCELRGKTAQHVIRKLKPIFATHGIPQKFFADNMPCNSLENLENLH